MTSVEAAASDPAIAKFGPPETWAALDDAAARRIAEAEQRLSYLLPSDAALAAWLDAA